MRKLIAFIFGISSISFSYSQKTGKYSSSEDDVANAINLYDQFTAKNAPVYNGKEYVFYTFRMKGYPFFLSEKFSKGWVSYEGKKYESIELEYDLTRNELVVLAPDRRAAMVLHNELVDSFGFAGYKFISLEKNENARLDYAGFYNLLYDGKTQILARRKKSIREVIEDKPGVRYFPSQDRFYIHKNGKYYPVNNSKDVYKVFTDKRKQVKKMMRRNHIKIKKGNFENSIVKAAQLYDEFSQ